jgi:hypothetical protein
MNVQLQNWNGNITLECEVRLELERLIGESSAEVNFTITHNARVIARGWCLLPLSVKLGTRTADVRLVVAPSTREATLLEAGDIKIDDQWISVLTHNPDPLQPHDRPRHMRTR